MVSRRSRLWTLPAALILCIALSVPPAQAGSELTQKQRYALAMEMTAPAQTAAALKVLSDEGYARAADRLAYHHFKGLGVDRDTAAAVALYRQAVAAGRTTSLVSLGKVYMTLGAQQKARDAFAQASAQGLRQADATLAWGQATGRLGPPLALQNGLAALRRLAAMDVREAQMYLLDALTRMPRARADVDAVVARLHARLEDGDAKAAEALLRYYRIRGHSRGTLAERARLLKTPGLRDKVRIEEALYLARDRQPGQFWTVSAALVDSAPRDVFARALTVTSKINKNAYVRIVQKELRALGYPVGRASPYMNGPLIRAITRFCRDSGIREECLQGPLKSRTIKAVAARIAARRS